jgi:hypothetical protein
LKKKKDIWGDWQEAFGKFTQGINHAVEAVFEMEECQAMLYRSEKWRCGRWKNQPQWWKVDRRLAERTNSGGVCPSISRQEK